MIIALKTEFSRHKRYGTQLSLIMLDVDHFKKVLTDGDQLVALADQALYHAKKNGRNLYEVLTASI